MDKHPAQVRNEGPIAAPPESVAPAAPAAAPEPVREDALPKLDLRATDFMDKAHATYAELAAHGPVTRVAVELDDQDGQGLAFFGREPFFVSGYDEVISSLLDDRLKADPKHAMTPEQLAKLPPVPEEFRPFSRSLLSVDPPDHTRLRKLVQPSFTAQAMEALRGRIQKIADDLLDNAERAAAERGEVGPNRRMDLVDAFAYPLPVKVISDMLGIPLEDREQVRGWTENLLRVDRGRGRRMDPDTRAKLKEFTEYLKVLFKRKRQAPTDDLITQLVNANDNGDTLDEEELLSMVFILYLAGHVTTVNLVANGVYGLLTHPDQLAKLKADFELAKGAVEETLRYWGPVDFIGRRIAGEDMELGGKHISKGDNVIVGLASADRDPKRFPNPEDFDITRPNANKNVAFGKGIHVCLGAPLARVEGQVAFTTLFRRFPDMRLAVPAEELRWSNSFLRGFKSLPVYF